MSDFGQLTTILLLGIMFGLFGKIAYDNLLIQIARIKEIIANNKAFKAKEDEVANMRANGDFHEWVDVMTPQGKIMLCRKTGWAPSLKGFVPMTLVNAYFENLKAQEEYKEFRDARVQLLAHELKMTVPQMERVVENVFSIKKDFQLQRLDKLSKELKGKAANVKSEGNQI